MVYVLLLLVVISMIGGTLVRAAIAQHRQRQRDEHRAQAVRLLEAGWNRAVRKLATQPDYAGETWQFDNDVLGSGHRAEVRIEVIQSDAEPKARTLSVVAEYPLGETFTNRVSQTGTISPMTQ